MEDRRDIQLREYTALTGFVIKKNRQYFPDLPGAVLRATTGSEEMTHFGWRHVGPKG